MFNGVEIGDFISIAKVLHGKVQAAVAWNDKNASS